MFELGNAPCHGLLGRRGHDDRKYGSDGTGDNERDGFPAGEYRGKDSHDPCDR